MITIFFGKSGFHDCFVDLSTNAAACTLGFRLFEVLTSPVGRSAQITRCLPVLVFLFGAGCFAIIMLQVEEEFMSMINRVSLSAGG